MITSHARNTNPTIKELLEALSAEERGEAAAARSSHTHQQPPTLHATPASTHRHTVEARGGTHAHAMRHAANASITPATSLDFEQGGGTPRGPFGSTGMGAQVPRHAPAPSPSHAFAFEMEEVEWSQRPRVHEAPPRERLSVDRERTVERLKSHVRLPAIARHALTAAGAIAIVLPSALYLAAPVLVRMEDASSAATPASVISQAGVISQRGVSVSAIDVSKRPTAPQSTDVAEPAATTALGAAASLQPSAGAAAATATPSLPLDASAPSPERTLALLERGRTLSAQRDITAARHFFVRAADSGSAEAALAAARSFDPAELAALGYIGIKGDASLARKYYAMAVAGGAPGAQEQLDRLPPP